MAINRKIVVVVIVTAVILLAGILVFLTVHGDPTGFIVEPGRSNNRELDEIELLKALPLKSPGLVSQCGDHPYIVLTFDDGPFVCPNLIEKVPATAHVLDELKQNGVVGTFFLAPGSQDGHFGQAECDILRRTLDEGHEVQWHTWSHADMLGDCDLPSEIAKCRSWLADQCHIVLPPESRSFTMLRPPFGNTNAEKNAALNKEGLTSVMWNVDSNDWRGYPYKEVQQNIKREATASSKLILMHDMWYRGGLIAWIKKEFPGHRFVTASTCYAACGPSTQC